MPFTLIPFDTAQAKMAFAPRSIEATAWCYSHWAGVAINTRNGGGEIQLCHLPVAGTAARRHPDVVTMRCCGQSELGHLHSAGGQVWGAAWSPCPIKTEPPCRSVPPGWSYECDMELGRFLYDHSERELQRRDCSKEHLSSVEVSSQVVRSGAPPQPKISVRHMSIAAAAGRSGRQCLSPP